jgi:hypothetical protein
MSQRIDTKDTAEDVDENRFYILVGEQNFERVRYLFLVGAPADIKEVRRIAAGKLDDIHGGHCQSGAIHHAGDVSVELDVVKSILRSFDLERIFFGGVAQVADVWMPEKSVVVEVDLGVECEYAAIFGGDQRIDFDERGVVSMYAL